MWKIHSWKQLFRGSKVIIVNPHHFHLYIPIKIRMIASGSVAIARCSKLYSRREILPFLYVFSQKRRTFFDIIFSVYISTGNPISWIMMAPALTPRRINGGANNPGLRLYKFDTDTGQVSMKESLTLRILYTFVLKRMTFFDVDVKMSITENNSVHFLGGYCANVDYFCNWQIESL